jgi:hypothetical protein
MSEVLRGIKKATVQAAGLLFSWIDRKAEFCVRRTIRASGWGLFVLFGDLAHCVIHSFCFARAD